MSEKSRLRVPSVGRELVAVVAVVAGGLRTLRVWAQLLQAGCCGVGLGVCYAAVAALALAAPGKRGGGGGVRPVGKAAEHQVFAVTG